GPPAPQGPTTKGPHQPHSPPLPSNPQYQASPPHCPPAAGKTQPRPSEQPHPQEGLPFSPPISPQDGNTPGGPQPLPTWLPRLPRTPTPTSPRAPPAPQSPLLPTPLLRTPHQSPRRSEGLGPPPGSKPRAACPGPLTPATAEPRPQRTTPPEPRPSPRPAPTPAPPRVPQHRPPAHGPYCLTISHRPAPSSTAPGAGPPGSAPTSGGLHPGLPRPAPQCPR
uniref:Uncharacterized protein n=1 Tax=Mustela putorius furo TaxID=9669 RepID=M3XM75_MUSPF